MYITIDSIFMNFLVIFIFVVIVLVQFYVILVRNGTFLLKKQIINFRWNTSHYAQIPHFRLYRSPNK